MLTISLFETYHSFSAIHLGERFWQCVRVDSVSHLLFKSDFGGLVGGFGKLLELVLGAGRGFRGFFRRKSFQLAANGGTTRF